MTIASTTQIRANRWRDTIPVKPAPVGEWTLVLHYTSGPAVSFSCADNLTRTRSDTVSRGPEPGVTSFYVLALGVNDPPSFTQLSYAEKDARDFCDVATRALTLAAPATLLVGKEVTKERFVREIERIQSQIGVQEGVGVLLYVAGHAFMRGDIYTFPLTTFDLAQPISTSISQSDLNMWRDELKRGVRVMILDTCYSGMMIQRVLDYGREGVAVLAASAFDQTARESNSYKNGLFTRVLCNILDESFKKKELTKLYDLVENVKVRFRVDYGSGGEDHAKDLDMPRARVDESIESVLVGKRAPS